MGFRRIILFALVSALLVPAQHAVARDPDASDEPRSSGPLTSTPQECEDNGRAKKHETKGQSCSWSYGLLPADSEPDEDFSAYWFQMELEPAKGECAMQLMFEIGLPDSIRVVSASLEGTQRISERVDNVARLSVDGGGSALVPGTIEQDTMVTVGRESGVMREHGYSYTWTGRSRDKVVLAVGVQLAHRSVPPELIYMTSEGHGAGWGACKPTIIYVGQRT